MKFLHLAHLIWAELELPVWTRTLRALLAAAIGLAVVVALLGSDWMAWAGGLR